MAFKILQAPPIYMVTISCIVWSY